MRKLGAKSIEAGVGCGVGFGHGFGVGMSRYYYSDLYMSSTKIVKLKGHSPGDVFIEQSVIGQTLFFKGREMIQGENMTL